ncbi:hypothetical protein AUR04nite_03050 [Glutamicibacter uratoxydans]|uniref:Uncharacterized protein n=1 Tax=Glutamicibacter uratoxydans TaxID=43667 RepID=A0A4Y4DJN7_GLUUR|nr:hypothetical protein AUR04nite_03050 [Glutamicibacter uratoxydans]
MFKNSKRIAASAGVTALLAANLLVGAPAQAGGWTEQVFKDKLVCQVNLTTRVMAISATVHTAVVVRNCQWGNSFGGNGYVLEVRKP